MEEGSDIMRFFSIGIEENNLGLKKSILRKIDETKPEGFIIEEKQAGNLLFINYILLNPYNSGPWNLVREKLQQNIADIITDFILNDMQLPMIERIVRDEFFYFEKEDMKHICREVLATVLGKKDGDSRLSSLKENWRARIRERIIEHLDTNSELIIDGFIRFRLKDFTKDLTQGISGIAEELLIEKEYNEFIKLLRYFVEIQEPKVNEVHVVVEDDRKYVLLDDSYRVINNDVLKELAKEISDKEISYDDLLISSLITIAPSKITIHDCEKIKNTELLNTINKVFRGKVSYEP
ncbi:MAG: putative sporulation protein YtxC [Clostridiales bacterium]|jgi:putative sporulation protein YtxC|nr:putative sporulation protein YtxC [Clostridiales bacterium]